MELLEHRLVVVEIELRRASGHEEVDDPLGLGGEVRLAEDAPALGDLLSRGRGEERGVQQRGERGGADADGGLAEELAAGLEELVVAEGVHVRKEGRAGILPAQIPRGFLNAVPSWSNDVSRRLKRVRPGQARCAALLWNVGPEGRSEISRWREPPDWMETGCALKGRRRPSDAGSIALSGRANRWTEFRWLAPPANFQPRLRRLIGSAFRWPRCGQREVAAAWLRGLKIASFLFIPSSPSRRGSGACWRWSSRRRDRPG